jgi:hypothetical protein
MLANFFGKSNPVNFIVIFSIFLGFYLTNSISSISLATLNFSLVLEYILMLIFFLVFFFFFNFILSKNKLTLYNSYGFLIFVLLFGFFPDTMLSRYELFLNILVLIYLRRVYSLRSGKDLYKKIFDSGFWLGVLFLIAPKTVLFGILLFLSIWLFQKINFRTLLIPCLGFLAPVLCYVAYFFWFDQTEEFIASFFWYANYNFELFTDSSIFIPTIVLGTLVLISILVKTPKVISISGNYRNYWILILFNLFIAITILLIQNTLNESQLILLFFPISVILTNWLESIQKPFLKNIFIAALLCTPIILFII